MDLRTLADAGDFLGGLGVVVSGIGPAAQIRGDASSLRPEIDARSLERMASTLSCLARGLDFTKLFDGVQWPGRPIPPAALRRKRRAR